MYNMQKVKVMLLGLLRWLILNVFISLLPCLFFTLIPSLTNNKLHSSDYDTILNFLFFYITLSVGSSFSVSTWKLDDDLPNFHLVFFILCVAWMALSFLIMGMIYVVNDMESQLTGYFNMEALKLLVQVVGIGSFATGVMVEIIHLGLKGDEKND